MICQICNEQMKKLPEDISRNPNNDKEYDRTVYQCETDDVWITTEFPRPVQ